MNEEKYIELVEKLEAFAQENPSRYRLYVALLAVLGYFYLLGSLVLILGVMVLFGIGIANGKVVAIGIKVEIGLCLLAGIILRSFVVSIHAPEGQGITHSDAPELFAMLGSICKALKAPSFHHVLLNDSFNAGIIQVPRLGPLGWQVNYLVIGLPLMKALSPDQFRAVIAHEIGHLSGNHSRFGGWIYRLRGTWTRLMMDLDRRGHYGAVLFRKFFDWYAPFFSAYSFVLARRCEYEADHCAAEVAGINTTVSTLIAISVQKHYLSTNFWPEIHKQADDYPEPAASPYATMFVTQEVKPADAARWFDSALSVKTDHADTHPCLSDRLEALGIMPNTADLAAILAEKPDENAAKRFLGPFASDLASHLDQTWKAKVAAKWKKRHEYATKTKKSLGELEEKARTGQALTADEAWNRASWTAEFLGPEAAIPLYQDVLEIKPDHAKAILHLGASLLEKDDPDGLGYIEQGMHLDGDAIIPGCQAAYAFYLRAGNKDKAEPYRKRARERMEKVQSARAERAGFTRKDSAWPHGLSPDQIQRLSAKLRELDCIQTAYLARKVVTLFPEQPYYVLFVEPRYGFASDMKATNLKVLAEVQRQVAMPGPTRIVVNHKRDPRLQTILRSGHGAQIYRRVR